MGKNSKHQESIIKNYYRNREAIAVQRLQELVTELYLSTGKKRASHWKNIALHLQKVGVPQSQIDHLVNKDNPALVAQLLQGLMEKS